MTPRIESKLSKILAYPLLREKGGPLPSDITAVHSWPLAAKECTSRKWKNCQLMAGNALFEKVQRTAWDRGQTWNPIVQEVRLLIKPLVEASLIGLPLPKDLVTKVGNSISWDLLGICLESEFCDLVQPFFCLPLLDPWYEVGHFPCGWDGDEFPEHWDGIIRGGKVMVF